MQAEYDELNAFSVRQLTELLQTSLQNKATSSSEEVETLLRSLYTTLLRQQPNTQQDDFSPLIEDGRTPLIDPTTQALPAPFDANPHQSHFDEEDSIGSASEITSIILKYYATRSTRLTQDKKKKSSAKQNSRNQASSSCPLTPDNPLFTHRLFAALEAVQKDPGDNACKMELYGLLDILFEYYDQNPDWQTKFDAFEKNQAEIIESIANANQASNQIKADQESSLLLKVKLLRIVLFAASAACYFYGSHDTQDEAAKNTFSSWTASLTTAIAYTATTGLAAFAGTSGPKFLIKFVSDIYAAYFRKKTPSSAASSSPAQIAASERPTISGKHVAGNGVALLFALFGAGSTIAMQVKNMEEKTGEINFYQIAAIVYSALLTNGNSLVKVLDTKDVFLNLFDVYKKAIPNIARLFKTEISTLDKVGLEEINTHLSQNFSTFWASESTTKEERDAFTELKTSLITSLGIKNLDAPGQENKLTLARLDEITFLLYQLKRIMNVLMLSLQSDKGTDFQEKLEEATRPQTRKRAATEAALASCFAIFAAVGAIPYWAVRGEAQTIFSKWFSSEIGGLTASYVACGFSTFNNVVVNVKSGLAVGQEFTVNLLDNLRETFASTNNPAEKAALLPTATMAFLVAMIYRYVTKDNHPEYPELVDDAAGASNGMNVCTSKPFFNKAMSVTGRGLSWCGSKIKTGFLYLKNGCKTPQSQETSGQRQAREQQKHRQALQSNISTNLANLLEQISGIAPYLSTKTTATMLKQMGARVSSSTPGFTGVAIASTSATESTPLLVAANRDSPNREETGSASSTVYYTPNSSGTPATTPLVISTPYSPAPALT